MSDYNRDRGRGRPRSRSRSGERTGSNRSMSVQVLKIILISSPFLTISQQYFFFEGEQRDPRSRDAPGGRHGSHGGQSQSSHGGGYERRTYSTGDNR